MASKAGRTGRGGRQGRPGRGRGPAGGTLKAAKKPRKTILEQLAEADKNRQTKSTGESDKTTEVMVGSDEQTGPEQGGKMTMTQEEGSKEKQKAVKTKQTRTERLQKRKVLMENSSDDDSSSNGSSSSSSNSNGSGNKEGQDDRQKDDTGKRWTKIAVTKKRKKTSTYHGSSPDTSEENESHPHPRQALKHTTQSRKTKVAATKDQELQQR